MRTLSYAHFSTIEYVIKGGDYNYISAHLPVDAGDDASLFAKIQIDGDSAQWYVEDYGDYKSILEASEEDRLAALQDLKARKERILARMAGKIKYAAQLFVIPDESQIFYTRRNGHVEAVLCQWGFCRRHDRSQQDIIAILLEKTPDPKALLPVQIQVLYSDRKPAQSIPVKMEWANSVQDFVTDTDGCLGVGSMVDGSTFTIVDPDGRRFPISVVSGKDLYEVVLPLYAGYDIQVVNQEGAPKPGYQVYVNGIPYQSDADAMIRPEPVLLEPYAKVEVDDETGHVENFILNREGNSFQFVVTDYFSSSLHILCNYDDGTPLEGFPVIVDGAEYLTDGAGSLFFPELEPGSTHKVCPSDNLAEERMVKLERGENEVFFIRKKEMPRMVRIRIRDYHGDPMPGIHLRLKLAKGPCEADTDADGYVTLPETLFTDKEKVKLSFDYEVPGKKSKKKD